MVEAANQEMVNLQCAEDEVISVSKTHAEHSTLIKGLIDDGGAEDDQPLPIPQVSASVMRKCMDFVALMGVVGAEPEIEQPLPSHDLAQHVDQRYAEYITKDVDQALLFDIVLAANYLDIKPLLKLGSAKIASLIKGKSIEEIRQFFQMDNDFTPEEEQRIREENQFAAEYF